MISLINPSKRGFGRVQYLGLKIEIEEHLFAGHTRIAVYNHFRQRGMITISYSRFCHYVRQYSIRKEHYPSNATTPVGQGGYSESSCQSRGFAIESNPSSKKLETLT